MRIQITIQQIDNGFVVKLFDEDGPIPHDQKVFFENFDDVLEKIKAWKKEAEELKEA